MKHLILVIALFFISSCGDGPVPIPKPRLYPKVDYPARNIEKLDLEYCAFTFEFPDYANAIQDSFYFEESILDKCWFDLLIPSLNGRLHCSYIPLKDRAHFDEMVEDAFELVFKHNVKANSREESTLNFPSKKLYGFEFEIDGPVASQYQFFLTDSLHHFLRGSLYFESQVDQDSIAPVLDFVKKDVRHMIQTFQWK